MSNNITVIAATLDEKELTLYTETGDSVVILQGDPRVAKLVPIIMPPLAAKKPITVDITIEKDRNYAKLEEKTNGFVKFYRIARSKLASIFNKHSEGNPETDIVEGFDYIGSRQQAAVTEIMENAVSSNSPMFQDVSVSQQELDNSRNVHSDEGDTVIAVVDGKTVVPDAQNIKHHIDHAAAGDAIGITNFYRRFAEVAGKRQHTARDLMKFIQKGDLHFADDGSLLIYKALKTKTAYGDTVDKNLFVDCHTGNVPQRIGSLVCMDPSLVDPNRANECSNGLHVARRQYIGNFGGDVLTLCKVAPEDVIAVPEYDANKMRVCGYHILFRLNPEDHVAIKSNRPLKTDEGKRMLAACIAGEHVGVLETVKIGGHKGTNITITNHVEKDAPVFAEVLSDSVAKLEKLQPVEALNATERENVLNGEKLDLKTVQSQKEETVVLSRKDQAKALYDAWVDSAGQGQAKTAEAYAALLAFKKACKVNWDKLGIPNDGSKPIVMGVDMSEPSEDEPADVIEELKQLFEQFNAVPGGTDDEILISRAFIEKWDESVLGFDDDQYNNDVGVYEDDVDLIRTYALKELSTSVSTPTAPTPSGKPQSARERIRGLLDQGPVTIGVAKEIVAIKKAAKKGWEKLGVSDSEAEDIETQAKV